MSEKDDNTQGAQPEKNILSEENAREQMQGLMDSYDIDPADLAIEHGPQWVATIVNRLVRAVRTGKLEILENGSTKQNFTTKAGTASSVTYARMNGIAMKAREKAKDSLDKDLALMTSLGNIASPSMLLDFDITDISVWQRLAQLFMVV